MSFRHSITKCVRFSVMAWCCHAARMTPMKELPHTHWHPCVRPFKNFTNTKTSPHSGHNLTLWCRWSLKTPQGIHHSSQLLHGPTIRWTDTSSQTTASDGKNYRGKDEKPWGLVWANNQDIQHTSINSLQPHLLMWIYFMWAQAVCRMNYVNDTQAWSPHDWKWLTTNIFFSCSSNFNENSPSMPSCGRRWRYFIEFWRKFNKLFQKEELMMRENRSDPYILASSKIMVFREWLRKALKMIKAGFHLTASSFKQCSNTKPI